MILKQYYLGCLAHASYLIADEETQTAVIVDPQRDIDQYLSDVGEAGLEIRHVFLSHLHADFLAGHLELRDKTGATIHLGRRAEAEYAFEPGGDGDALEFGNVRLEILETPGHSPESISIVVYDLAESSEKPHAVLTGDTLFIGDVGRPDLRASLGWTAEQLGALLYESLHGKLMKLPAETLVYPAHGAGSLCGKNMSEDTVSTIGVQRTYNYALQPMEKEAFIAIVNAEQPDAPDYFTYDAILNSREHATLETALETSLKGLGVEELRGLMKKGARVLDVREPPEYAGAHVKGSLNIALDGKYATWCGTLLKPEEEIVLIAEPGRESEGALRLGRIGYDRVVGYLEGGMQPLESHPDLVSRIERIAAATLAERIEEGDSVTIVDVRAQPEWEERCIKGSVNIPLAHLGERIDELGDGPIVVHCQSGYRSSIAASLLESEELSVSDLVGGWPPGRQPVCRDG